MARDTFSSSPDTLQLEAEDPLSKEYADTAR